MDQFALSSLQTDTDKHENAREVVVTPKSKCISLTGSALAFFLLCASSPANAVDRKGPAKVMGGIPAPEVGARIREVKPDLKKCQGKLSSNAKGVIWVRFEITGETGVVQDAHVLELDKALDKGAFKNCVLEVIKKQIYGKMPKGRNTRVEYPFTYPM